VCCSLSDSVAHHAQENFEHGSQRFNVLVFPSVLGFGLKFNFF